MKFNILTFGCKVNQYESNMMKEKMLSSSFLFEENLDKADIIIVNTCSVTNVADKKCLKTIRKIKREYPEKVLAITGCSSQNKQEIYEKLDADILIGNKDKSKIADYIKEFLQTEKHVIKFYNERNLEFEDMMINNYNHVRAFIKIEDGCDNFCSYCIIPFVRGSVRSKKFAEVINEAKILAEKNHKEIVLTGIHTGRYESDNHDLTDLINALSKIEEIKRIRISSIEITELNDKFLNMLKENPKVCDHLHIPLQAGSNEILKRMNRKYDLEFYENKIKEIRNIRPDISISTDIIVGFPYETDELFAECLKFSEKMEFSKIHVFPYSLREGTAAAQMDHQVPAEIKKNRVRKLIELSNKLEKNYIDKFKGKSLDILVEECNNNISIGHTSNYIKMEVSENLEIGQIYSRIL